MGQKPKKTKDIVQLEPPVDSFQRPWWREEVLTAVRRTLPNGLRVIVLQLPHLHSVSSALMVRAGPRYETQATNGLSHLVEHLLFRGTTRHPSSYSLNAAIEALGGEVNGLTQRDATTIHMTVPPQAAEAGLALLGEICTEPNMEGLDIEKEVVIEEVLDTIDANGFENDIDTLSRQVLWAGHPISMPVAGTVRQVERFTLRQCKSHFARTFVGENAVLCVAGPVDPERILAAAGPAFGKMPRGKPLADGPAPLPAIRQPITVQETDDSQVAVLLSFPAPHENDPDFSKLLLLRRVLDDGLSSRLRQAVCEQRGLAYSVSAAIDVYADAGAIDLDASCAPRKLVVTVAQMLATLKSLIEGGVEEEELARAKVRHRAELEFGLDDPSELCGWYGSSELMGVSGGYQDRLDEAMSVTRADLDRLAASIFDPSKAVLTLVGPAHPSAVAKLERLLGRPAGSTVWLNTEEVEEEPADDGIEPVEMRMLSEWSAAKVAPPAQTATVSSDDQAEQPLRVAG